MKLVDPQKVVDRMNLQRAVGSSIPAATDSILEGITPVIESILGSGLESAKKTDYFAYSRSVYASYKPTTFKLDRRFVAARTVKVYVSVDGLPVTDLEDTTKTKLLTNGVDYFLNHNDGEVLVTHSLYPTSRSMVVTYSAGFDDQSEDVPEWLQQAAIAGAIRVHNSHTVKHNKKDVPDMSKELAELLMATLSDHRYSGLTVTYPEYSITK